MGMKKVVVAVVEMVSFWVEKMVGQLDVLLVESMVELWDQKRAVW